MPPDTSRQIEISGRTIDCDSIADRSLLTQAKAIIKNREAAEQLSIDRLHAIFDACRLYALGAAQHALREVVADRLPSPARDEEE
ncbi:hypothetical protein [Lacipirellula sp.]|uniref:hypothetical protein n=1 Tax=Lacipirellula sp. TaxID=2691419 RepID=UPI003D0FE227